MKIVFKNSKLVFVKKVWESIQNYSKSDINGWDAGYFNANTGVFSSASQGRHKILTVNVGNRITGKVPTYGNNVGIGSYDEVSNKITNITPLISNVDGDAGVATFSVIAQSTKFVVDCFISSGSAPFPDDCFVKVEK